MKNKKMIIIITMFTLVISVFGCGSKDTESMDMNNEPKKTESFDITSLITKEEAENAIGMEVKDAIITEQEAIGQVQCFYDGVELDIETGFVQLSILRTENMPDNGQTVEGIYSDIKDNDLDKEAIDEIGDDAFWGTGGLHVLKGDVYFNISVGNSDVKGNIEICKNLAKIVLERL